MIEVTTSTTGSPTITLFQLHPNYENKFNSFMIYKLKNTGF